MNRIVLKDGRFFNLDTAVSFSSNESGTLYRTAKGNYIICFVDKYGNKAWSRVSQSDAETWLIKNGYYDEVDEKILDTYEL